jgi:hypothetical protein
VTIRKGEPWGAPGALPDDGVVVRSDAEARAVVETARRAGQPLPSLGLLGGDLCHTLGGTGDESRLRDGRGTIVSIDLGAVLTDGRLHWFVAHAVARRSWWFGRIVAVMNAEHLGNWDVAPRAHPGDGLLDVFDVTMPVGERIKARSRLRTGSHLPHPDIRTRRSAAVQLELDRPTPVWLDGTRITEARRLSFRLEPDALTCVV